MRKILLLLPLLVSPTFADRLPQLNEKPWIGWYAASEQRNFRFGVKSDGEGVLIPMKGRDETASPRKWIDFMPVIEEVLPSGRIVTKENLEDGWEAVTPVSDDAEKITYRGTVTGGARFEVNLEIDGNEVRGGGRILEKGELTENPIQFSLRVRIPNVYHFVDDPEDIEELAERDKIQIERIDGKKLKFDAWKPVWAEKEDCSGPGVQTARVDLDGMEGFKVDLEAGDKGAFHMYNGSLRPLYKGVTFGWRPDPAKDADGKGRFVLEFK